MSLIQNKLTRSDQIKWLIIIEGFVEHSLKGIGTNQLMSTGDLMKVVEMCKRTAFSSENKYVVVGCEDLIEKLQKQNDSVWNVA